MMAFFFSPVAGTLLGLFLVICLICVGLRSVGNKIASADVPETPSVRETNRRLGPMTWQEHVASALLIVIIVAVAVGLAMIT